MTIRGKLMIIHAHKKLDVTILRIIGDFIEIKGSARDMHLGGDDFDNKLADYCLKTCELGKPIDKIDKKSRERLKKACEYAKKFFSQKTKYEII